MTGHPAEKMDPYFGFDIKSLMAMLTYRRPHASKTEEKFIEKYIDPLGAEQDGFGNRWLKIEGVGDAVLWSCHTDTVHYKDGMQATSKKNDIVTLNKKSKANCLGADDTAGVWLMVEMIKAGKPGTYVFHRGEECGGLGSDFVQKYEPERLDGILAAIALDRKGYDSVITYQGARCCSDAFANSLADAIEGLEFRRDDTGLFTDTANYTHLVPECTNLSVGYGRQHTAKEWLDIAFLCALLDSLLRLDTEKLVIERDPAVESKEWWEEDDTESWYYQKDAYDTRWHEGPVNGTTTTRKQSDIYDIELDHMIRFCEDDALVVAKMLIDDGYTIDELYQAKESYRMVKKYRDDYGY